ncbi:MAG: hypothetical protein GW795_11975 [Cyanobacteria bacterium]|nr:hypothetical protein [Cyanobacteria bacterium CG_2015-16_32_12]NCO77492.1 hypothetical protein [Cyanobacteria bacterium CG_2015-22_32_23]NCQ04167.1 hypothetical protein [Cyanobacteria bacterium CG_2015-09_32_10]NCQ42564.1 hypothetical protein [Cyanobacteria bacterium CG_2015-04_32_10]NCS84142.1 hypothetical protein [Cyanobacteria bacterium CG_2015-02_32_10]
MSSKKSDQILSQMALSLLTPSVVITQLLGNEIMELLENMGKASEEIFRGERLPILKNHSLDSNP